PMRTLRSSFAQVILSLLIASSLAIAGDIDRTKRPAAKPVPKVQLPAIEKKTLSNGLQVWLVGHHELPVVAFNLVILAGSDHDPVTMPGLSSMTADLLDEGTNTRSSLQIADELESIGASLNTGSGTDGSSITLNTLKKHLDKALGVFTDVLTNPTFP